jgi:signal peptide peptidase SppA
MHPALDILNGPWAIRPDMLEQINAIWQARSEGQETAWLKAYRESGSPARERFAGYQTVDRVAVVPVDGVLARKMNVFEAVSGGSSYESISHALSAALADPGVDAIALAVSSPGGEVHGVQTLAEQISAARAVKPLAAWSDSKALSAAYWLAAAAGPVYLGSSTAEAGSIGVIANHTDLSGAEEKAGVKTTQIYSGKYKALGSPHKPLSKDDRASIQEKVDYAASIFVENVAKYRGVSVDEVLDKMAEGRTFMGQQAVDAGLVDGIATLDAVVADLKSEAAKRAAKAEKERFSAMDKKTLMAEHAALADELVAEGREAGIKAERDRIAGIQASALPGHDSLIAQMIADGTPLDQARARIIDAAKASMQATAQNRNLDVERPLPNADGAKSESTPKSRAEQAAAARKFAAENGIDFAAAFHQLFEAQAA